ncbi:hypothetical protein HYW20_06115 [Candidatus Woesearchaeota archaeon]|nr:hypothetical protein [Candidatus Woesearchaeota archaeon]
MYLNGKYLKIGIVTEDELLDKIRVQYVKWKKENMEGTYSLIPKLILRKNGCWIVPSNGDADSDSNLKKRLDMDQPIVSFLYRNYLRMYNIAPDK